MSHDPVLDAIGDALIKRLRRLLDLSTDIEAPDDPPALGEGDDEMLAPIPPHPRPRRDLSRKRER